MAAVQKQESIVAPTNNEKLTTILSIHGGRIRDIIPLTILDFLETQLQKLGGPEARIADYFDVIGGPSTGGMVTAMLTAPSDNDDQNGRPIPVKKMMAFYSMDGPKIFSEKARDGMELLNWLIKPKYDGVHLRRKVKEFCKGTLLSNTLTNVVIPNYDLKKMCPVIFSIRQVKEKNSKVKLEDVVMGISTAPSLFPFHEFKADDKSHFLVDGGLVANNPILLAIREATKILGKENASNYTQENINNEFLILSLGTGSPGKRSGHKIPNGGLWDWLINLETKSSPLFDAMFMALDDMISIYATHFSENRNIRDNYLRIQDYSMKVEDLRTDVDANKRYLKKLEDIGRNLLKLPALVTKTETGLVDRMPHDTSLSANQSEEVTKNDAALISFAEKLSKERKRRHSSNKSMVSINNEAFTVSRVNEIDGPK